MKAEAYRCGGGHQAQVDRSGERDVCVREAALKVMRPELAKSR
jgi:hypothetical protein